MSRNERQAKALAETVRRDHALGDGPIKDLFELVHAVANIDVISMPVTDPSEHGLSMRDPQTGTIVIAVATTTHPMRQRSSIAHELGHVLSGDLDAGVELTPGERTPEEIRADAFARHLLLPHAGVKKRRGGRAGAVTLAQLSDLVQKFEVSPSLAAIQLRELKLIDQTTCSQWSALSASNLAMNFGWGSQYRSLVADASQPRAPQGLMARSVVAYRQGQLGIVELANWYQQDADELAAQLGPVAPQTTETEYWDDDAPLFPEGSAEPRS